MLFSDIVDSTRRAAALGDEAWRAQLDAHDAVVRRLVPRYGGRMVRSTGDGFLATFDLPSRAARCASAICAALADEGLAVRIGIHASEIERRGEDIGGIGVHVAARIAAIAGAHEILVSGTVKDLTTGSGFRFHDRGMHRFKGLDDEWHVLALEDRRPV